MSSNKAIITGFKDPEAKEERRRGERGRDNEKEEAAKSRVQEREESGRGSGARDEGLREGER